MKDALGGVFEDVAVLRLGRAFLLPGTRQPFKEEVVIQKRRDEPDEVPHAEQGARGLLHLSVKSCVLSRVSNRQQCVRDIVVTERVDEKLVHLQFGAAVDEPRVPVPRRAGKELLAGDKGCQAGGVGFYGELGNAFLV